VGAGAGQAGLTQAPAAALPSSSPRGALLWNPQLRAREGLPALRSTGGPALCPSWGSSLAVRSSSAMQVRTEAPVPWRELGLFLVAGPTLFCLPVEASARANSRL